MPDPSPSAAISEAATQDNAPVTGSDAPGGPSVRINLKDFGVAAKSAYKWRKAGIAVQEQRKMDSGEIV